MMLTAPSGYVSGRRSHLCMQHQSVALIGVIGHAECEVHLHGAPSHDPQPLLVPVSMQVPDQAREALGVVIGRRLSLDLGDRKRSWRVRVKKGQSLSRNKVKKGQSLSRNKVKKGQRNKNRWGGMGKVWTMDPMGLIISIRP